MDIVKKYEQFQNGKSSIVILSTGGTIEKTYDEVEGSLGNRESVIQNRFLDRLRYPYTEFIIKVIMSKDSLDMEERDRALIYEAICEQERLGVPIVVLHGTDTVDETLKYCHRKIQEKAISVPVVFTGSMRPLGFVDSDAKQNVIEAISMAKMLDPGFYLSFHGEVFLPPYFRKNREKRTFEKLVEVEKK